MSSCRTHYTAYWILSLSALFLYKEEVLQAVSLEMLLLSLLVGTVYSILPDIDMPSSLLRRLVERVLLGLAALSMLAFLSFTNILYIHISLAIVGVLLLLWFLRHRGFFHTVSAGVMLSLPLALLHPCFAVFGFFGFLSHLALDGKAFNLF
ncbi:MAG: metal-dependent hydrolase [Candidatus Altiarchaeota archaeon]|nr:metal-dependent hydrolase [Candidatus Altiarchaeota archaeon]